MRKSISTVVTGAPCIAAPAFPISMASRPRLSIAAATFATIGVASTLSGYSNPTGIAGRTREVRPPDLKLHLLRHHERLPVVPRAHAIRFRIAPHQLGRA